jgi:CRISPR-associated endoribonuclease Cas6
MRFKLSLQIQPEVMGNELPINYQFPLQAAIYKTLANSDAEFATWLHENGYQQDGKRFKLFTFSNLIVPQYGIGKERERLEIKSDYVTLLISFLPEKSTQKFIQWIFNNRTIQIADHLSGVQFVVREIQVMSPLNYKPDMVFRTLSPICISLRNERGHMDYLAPNDSRYELGLLTGLLARYNVIHGEPFSGDSYCHLQLLNEPKSSLVRIKAGTPNETRVRGYRYQFKIDLPEELMQIAYESGLGEKGSMGFGMIG